MFPPSISSDVHQEVMSWRCEVPWQIRRVPVAVVSFVDVCPLDLLSSLHLRLHEFCALHCDFLGLGTRLVFRSYRGTQSCELVRNLNLCLRSCIGALVRTNSQIVSLGVFALCFLSECLIPYQAIQSMISALSTRSRVDGPGLVLN